MYKDYHKSICFQCHIPQTDDQFHVTVVKGSREACDHPNVIAPVAYGVYKYFGIQSAAAKHFWQRMWISVNQFTNWINVKPIKGQESNLSALFLWYRHILNKFVTHIPFT